MRRWRAFAHAVRFLNNYNEGNYLVRRQAECDESLLHIAARKMIVQSGRRVREELRRRKEVVREVDERREEEEVKAKEKEEAARGRRTPYTPLPPPSPCLLLPSVASLPPLPPSPSVTLTTFLFARFSPASQGPPGIMPRSSLRMLNANLPSPPAVTPFSLPSRPFFRRLRRLHHLLPGSRRILPPLSSPRKTVAPRGTAGQRLRGIFDADSWLVPRSIGVRLCRELRVA